MEAKIRVPDPGEEYLTPEGCWILESWNQDSDDAVSIARARIEPGVTTKLHRLTGTVERYVILEGTGTVTIGELAPQTVGPGDIVIIPPEVSQKITNDGCGDLLFYCVCTPRFVDACYVSLE